MPDRQFVHTQEYGVVEIAAVEKVPRQFHQISGLELHAAHGMDADMFMVFARRVSRK